MASNTYIAQLNELDEGDLVLIERDLAFYELVSLGFLLYGDDGTNAHFVLQKLLVLSNNNTNNRPHSDLLRSYATLNADNWRACLVEALAIIGAKRVLRKMGFEWEELRQHYLPHIDELSLHVHPLLKTLYKICERLKPADAGRLVLQLNEQQQRRDDNHIRFYDYSCLEIYLLDWVTRRIISLGDHKMSGCDVQVLINYFKLNDLHVFKELLVSTIKSNTENTEATGGEQSLDSNAEAVSDENPDDSNRDVDAAACCAAKSCTEQNPRLSDQIQIRDLVAESKREMAAVQTPYLIRKDEAGLLLIINQKNFHREVEENIKHLLPKKDLTTRTGTDVDKVMLKKVFGSFGYTPEEHDNLSHMEMLHVIRDAVKRSFLFDSIIISILSHGSEGVVYGANSIPVDIADIEHIMADPSLQGKPKMLIIQACQERDAPTNNPRNKKTVCALAYTDMLKAMATMPGFISLRHTIEGSWFIQSLCAAVDKLGDRIHMLDILTTVNNEVTNKRGTKNEVMVPLNTNTLTRPFQLPKRESS